MFHFSMAIMSEYKVLRTGYIYFRLHTTNSPWKVGIGAIQILQGVSKESRHSWETKTTVTSYSETTRILDLKLWQQGVLLLVKINF